MAGTSRQLISIPIVETTVLKKKSCRKVSIYLGVELKRYLAEFRLNSSQNLQWGFPYLGWSMHIQKSGSSDSTQLRACKKLKGWVGCKRSREARSTNMQAS